MNVQAIILRATLGQGKLWTLTALSDKLGKITFTAISSKSVGFAPFSLIEATIEQKNGRSICKEAHNTDTFLSLRNHEGASKAACLIREIIERCIPMHVPVENIWTLVLPLLGTLHTFSDWKAAPLLLALTLYEHEGISPQTLTNQPTLSAMAREIAERLLLSDIGVWKKTEIPEEILVAALETIGMKEAKSLAKGGT